jgi:hypothetical protein
MLLENECPVFGLSTVRGAASSSEAGIIMRVKNRSKSERIRDALIRDGMSYVIGLSKIPIPIEAITECIKIRAGASPANFVDWRFEDWPRRYHREVEGCLGLYYEGKKLLLPQAIVLDNTSDGFKLSDIYVDCIEEPFCIPDDVRDLTEISYEQLLQHLRKTTNYSNEQNVRLIDITQEDNRVTLTVQPVEYDRYVHTNLVLDAKPKGKNQSLREYIHPCGKLEALRQSPLANNLGINALLFTPDGSLVLQVRSRKVAFNRGQVCPSASGTVSLLDVRSGKSSKSRLTLDEVPKLREAFEELGIMQGDVQAISFLGITRELIRGGEPDMYFCAKSRISGREIARDRWKDARDKWEARNLLFHHLGGYVDEDLSDDNAVHKFLGAVDDFLDQHIDKASMPLLTAIALWVKYRLTCRRPQWQGQ